MADDKPKGYLEQPHLHTQAPFRSALLINPGNFKGALDEAVADPKKTLFGIGTGIPSTFVTKVLASTKPDFIWIDVEHGMFDRLQLNDCIHAAQHHSEGKAMVIVRVPKHDTVSLSTALDAGAAGIVIPHVESAQEVKDKMKEIYFPPKGQRSYSPWTFTPGINDQSLYPGDPFNIRTYNDHTVIIPQVESVKGIENVDEIAAVPGVSAIMFGPGDFMVDAGCDLNAFGAPNPVFDAAVAKFSAAAKRNNVPLFGAALSVHMIPTMIEQGYRAIAVAFDLWGFSNMVKEKLDQAAAYASQHGEAKKE